MDLSEPQYASLVFERNCFVSWHALRLVYFYLWLPGMWQSCDETQQSTQGPLLWKLLESKVRSRVRDI